MTHFHSMSHQMQKPVCRVPNSYISLTGFMMLKDMMLFEFKNKVQIFKYSLMQYTVNNIHLFTRNTEVHSIDTRQNINLFHPSTSFTKVLKGAYYSGIKIYNHLPWEQLSNDQKSFGFALKRFLYANSFYSLNYKCKRI
jgi:hypothetical protein